MFFKNLSIAGRGGVAPSTPGGNISLRRWITVWAVFGALALLATMLTTLSPAGAQTPDACTAGGRSPAPLAAEGFTATAIPGDGNSGQSEAQITLNWSPGTVDCGSTILYWQYMQSTPATNVWIPIPGSDHLTVSHTITGLEFGTAYEFMLRAASGAGIGLAATSAEVVVPTVPQAPRWSGTFISDNNPDPITITAAGTAIHLSVHNEVTAAMSNAGVSKDSLSGFSPITRISYRFKAGDRAWTPWGAVVDIAPSTDPSYLYAPTSEHARISFIGLTPGIGYIFELRQWNEYGPSAATSTLSINDGEPILFVTAPGQPRSLSVSAGDGEATLTWEPPYTGGLSTLGWQYRVAEADADGIATFTETSPAWNAVPASSVASMRHTVRGLDNAKRYRFQMRATNEVGPGNSATTEVVDPGAAPGSPTDIQAVADRDSVTLTWLPPLDDALNVLDNGSPILRYEYSQKSGGGGYGAWVAIASNALFHAGDTDRVLDTTTVADVAQHATAMGTEISDLTPGAPYSFRVRAVNATGAGSYVEIGQDDPVFPGSVPRAPEGLTARTVYGVGATDAQIVLSWNPGNNGGSPVTAWEYLAATSLTDLFTGQGDDNRWITICDSDQASGYPACDNSNSVSLPRTYGTDSGSEIVPPAIPDSVVLVVTSNTEKALTDDTYYFMVRARNAQGAGLQSGTTNAKFTPTTPSAPTSLFASGSTTSGSFELAWTPALNGGSPITAYEYATRIGGGVWGAWTSAGVGTAATVPVATEVMLGTSYQFRVRAVNAIGTSTYTESAVVAYGAPGVPGQSDPNVLETISGREVPAGTLLATPSSTDPRAVIVTLVGTTSGTNPETRWEYNYKTTGVEYGTWVFNNRGTDFNDGSPLVVAGLRPGVWHTFGVRALNGDLAGPVLESNTVIPGTAPPAPIGLTAAAGDESVLLSWITHTFTGPPISKWQYRINDGDWVDVAASDPSTREVTVTGLPDGTSIVNGNTYTFQVRAVNAVGDGQAALSNAVTPGSQPNAPRRVTATAGDSQATIVVTAPQSSTGGRVVDGYQVRKSRDGGAYDAWVDLGNTRSSAQDPLTAESAGVVVSGLANGSTYTFQVRATNSFGPGEQAESNTVTPKGVAVLGELDAAAGDSHVVLDWDEIADGGTEITGWQYRVKVNDEGYGPWVEIADSNAATATHTVSGLSNGVTYTFQVRAVHPSNVSTPIESEATTPSVVPLAPIVTAERGNGMVTLSWTPDVSAEVGDVNYAVPATGWQIQVDGGEWIAISILGVDANGGQLRVPDLTNGNTYTFAIRGVNSQGPGAAGITSATPATTPSAPNVAAERDNAGVVVSWTAVNDGGAAITGWELQVSDEDWVDLTVFGVGIDARQYHIADLDPVFAHTLRVRAVNNVGTGDAGMTTITAANTPGAPSVSAIGGDGEITVAWTTGDDGGAPITGWQYRVKVSIADYGDWVEVSEASLIFTDIGAGTGSLDYTFQVRAVNVLGEGAVGTSDPVLPIQAREDDGLYYSGTINGPDFCANFSLGGARLFAHDSDGDGVADVCSLPYTRREAIARQMAVNELAIEYADEFTDLVNAACEATDTITDDGGNNACGGEALASPPSPPINDGGPYYSGVINGPTFCANFSLGGPTTYPHDSDGDGVADVCSLPYTRREAIARQLAGDILAVTYSDDFSREIARSCRSLVVANYGDNPADLAKDICA